MSEPTELLQKESAILPPPQARALVSSPPSDRLVRTMQIEHRGAALTSILTLPLNAEGIVLCANSNTQAHHQARDHFLTQCFILHGIAVLQVSLITDEEEADEEVAGNFHHDPVILAARLHASTQWMCNQPFLQHLGMGCLGFGSGGTAAMMVAATRSVPLKALAVCNALPGPMGEKLPNILAPTLLIASEIPEAHKRLNEVTFSQLRCEKEMAVVGGAKTLATGDTLEQVATLATNWFHRHLCKAPVS